LIGHLATQQFFLRWLFIQRSQVFRLPRRCK